MKRDKTFSFEFNVDGEMTASEIWPDGDGPENPTIEDVLNEIKRCGGAERIFRDWGFEDAMSLRVHDLTETLEKLEARAALRAAASAVRAAKPTAVDPRLRAHLAETADGRVAEAVDNAIVPAPRREEEL